MRNHNGSLFTHEISGESWKSDKILYIIIHLIYRSSEIFALVIVVLHFKLSLNLN